MIIQIFLLLNFCLGLEVGEQEPFRREQQTIEIRAQGLPFSQGKEFLIPIRVLQAGHYIFNKEFYKVEISLTNHVDLTFARAESGRAKTFQFNFRNMYEYNQSVDDVSLKIDYDLIERIRKTLPSTEPIRLTAIKRFSQLQFFEGGFLKSQSDQQEGKIRLFDSFLPEDPVQATSLELARLGLLNAGFITSEKFVESLRELTELENTHHRQSTGYQRYVVKISSVGEFVVTMKNQIFKYPSPQGQPVELKIPEVLFFKTLDGSAVISCEQLLNL